MVDFKNAIKEYYKREIEVINGLDKDEINEAMNVILEAYQNNKNIYICGNGGSASTSTHFANDFNKGISEKLERKFNFISLTDNIATIMAIANDRSYDDVFMVQIENKIKENDVFIGISGSGNSMNVIKALEYAKTRGAKTIGISGYTGGKLKSLSDYHMHADIIDMQVTEDIHMSFDHMMMKIFWNYLYHHELSGDNLDTRGIQKVKK